MSDIAAVVADNLNVWTGAIERKSGAGRGGGKRISLYGIDRLRALIIDLAVRGKLVPQDAGDEPASELLKRVDKYRARLFPKLKAAPNPTAANTNIVIPLGWETVRLDRLANSQAGFAFKSKGFNEVGAGLPLIRIRDVGQPFTGTFYAGEYREEFVVTEGNYLISMDGEFRVATWPGPNALLNQRVSRLQFYGEQTSKAFVAMVLQRELKKVQGVKAYTTVDHLSGKQIAEINVVLPPLAEQQRIVAKVDELMALCDALERESAEAMGAHQALVEILLATLVNSADATDLARDWARLERHFDTLFTTDASIDALKQTILDLAVCGKLSRANDWSKKAEPLGNFAKLQNGYAFKSEWFANDGIRLLRNINVSHGSIEWDDAVYLPKSMADIYERFRLSVGDIILTLDRPFIATGTKVATVSASDLPALLLQRVGRFQVGNKIRSDFIFLWVSSPLFSKQVDPGRSNGVPHISSKQVEAAKIFVPSLAEQRRIVAKVDALMALCNALKARLSDAAQTQRKLADVITERAAA